MSCEQCSPRVRNGPTTHVRCLRDRRSSSMRSAISTAASMRKSVAAVTTAIMRLRQRMSSFGASCN
eukprot:scaffold207879_cov35-Tisochrysis_lutea.AAC.2